MAINFGLLQGVPNTTKVVGTIPVTSQPDGFGQLVSGLGQGLSGLASGIQQGKENKRADALLGIQQNQEARAVDLYPTTKATAQALLEDQQGKNQDAAQTRRDAAALREAAEQGEKNYLNVLMKQDPVKATAYQKTKADYAKVLADTAGVVEDNKKKALELADQYAIAGGNMANNAMSHGRTPEEQQKIWEIHLSYLSPELRKIFPPKLDDSAASFLQKAGADAQANVIEANSNKNATPEMKNSKRLSILEDLEKKGTLTDQGKLELKNLREQTRKVDPKESKPAIQQVNEYIGQLEQKKAELIQSGGDTAAIDQEIERAKRSTPNQPGITSKIVDSVIGAASDKFSTKGTPTKKSGYSNPFQMKLDSRKSK